MNNSTRKELESHILDMANDGVLTDDNFGDWHFHCFNEDYYIIGYYQASEWLKYHNIDPFEAIGICQEYEKDNFGECSKVYDSSEITVNMLIYIYGEEIINNLEATTIEELIEELS